VYNARLLIFHECVREYSCMAVLTVEVYMKGFEFEEKKGEKNSNDIDNVIKGVTKAYQDLKKIEQQPISIVIGDTGAGKSAFICSLYSNGKLPFHKKGTQILFSRPEGNKGPAIGSGPRSKTVTPHAYVFPKEENCILVDTAGFKDNGDYKSLIEISTEMAIRMSSVVQSVILVIAKSSITGDRGEGISNLSEKLKKIFGSSNISSILTASTQVIITKAEKDTREEIIEELVILKDGWASPKKSVKNGKEGGAQEQESAMSSNKKINHPVVEFLENILKDPEKILVADYRTENHEWRNQVFENIKSSTSISKKEIHLNDYSKQNNMLNSGMDKKAEEGMDAINEIYTLTDKEKKLNGHINTAQSCLAILQSPNFESQRQAKQKLKTNTEGDIKYYQSKIKQHKTEIKKLWFKAKQLEQDTEEKEFFKSEATETFPWFEPIEIFPGFKDVTDWKFPLCNLLRYSSHKFDYETDYHMPHKDKQVYVLPNQSEDLQPLENSELLDSEFADQLISSKEFLDLLNAGMKTLGSQPFSTVEQQCRNGVFDPTSKNTGEDGEYTVIYHSQFMHNASASVTYYVKTNELHSNRVLCTRKINRIAALKGELKTSNTGVEDLLLKKEALLKSINENTLYANIDAEDTISEANKTIKKAGEELTTCQQNLKEKKKFLSDNAYIFDWFCSMDEHKYYPSFSKIILSCIREYSAYRGENIKVHVANAPKVSSVKTSLFQPEPGEKKIGDPEIQKASLMERVMLLGMEEEDAKEAFITKKTAFLNMEKLFSAPQKQLSEAEAKETLPTAEAVFLKAKAIFLAEDKWLKLKEKLQDMETELASLTNQTEKPDTTNSMTV